MSWLNHIATLSCLISMLSCLPIASLNQENLFTDLNAAYKKLSNALDSSPEQRSQVIDLFMIFLSREIVAETEHDSAIEASLFNILSELFAHELQSRGVAQLLQKQTSATARALFEYRLDLAKETTIFPFRRALLCVLLETYRIKITPNAKLNRALTEQSLLKRFSALRRRFLIMPGYATKSQQGPDDRAIRAMISTLLWNIQPYTEVRLKPQEVAETLLLTSKAIFHLALTTTVLTFGYLGFKAWQNNMHNPLESFHIFLHGTTGEEATQGLIDCAKTLTATTAHELEHASKTLTQECAKFLNGRDGVAARVKETSRAGADLAKHIMKKV